MMERRQFLQITGKGGLGFLMAATLSGCAGSRKEASKPNFVFILVDDLGWKDVGFMGSEYYETPVIDRLASQGMHFTNAYSNAPNCAPTRACLLSGQYGPRHGVYTVGTAERGDTRLRKLIPTPNKTTLDSDIITIAEALKPAGYVSASIGKWHLGDDPKLGPVSQGFDVNIGGDHNGHPPAGYFSPYHLPNLDNAPQGEYLTDRLTNEALRFIERNQDHPFFLYLPHYAVHKPVQAPESIVEKYRNKPGSHGQNNPEYAAMIESVDTNIGRILHTLEELHLAENTVVVFFSDNGGHGNVTSMEPLRGSKGMIYEGGIRVPLIVRWPGRISSGTVCKVPVIGLDFYPTILEMAGVDLPDQVLDGESLVPLLRGGQQLRRDAIFWHFPA
ncbi:MAG: sulfatase, partial [Calditrichota bacterium]